MSSFSKPDSFVRTRAEPVVSQIPLSISDMSAILAEHLRIYLDNPEAFSGLPEIQSSSLLSDIEIFQEPTKIAKSGKTDWILVTPAAIKHSLQPDMTGLGVTVQNSSAPKYAHVRMLSTAAGSIPERETPIIERSVLIVISLRSVQAMFTAADAVYTWLAAMRPILKLEFGDACAHISLVPAQPASEVERPLFAPIAGNPLVTGIVVTTFPVFRYGDMTPP